MPQHTAGDLIYLPHPKSDYFLWVDEPCYRVDLWVVENSPNDFEEVFIDYSVGDEIHFINMLGQVVSDYFHAPKHAKLVRNGNAFKSLEEAEWINEQVRKFLQEKGHVISQRDVMQMIQWIQDDTKAVAIQKIRDRYLL